MRIENDDGDIKEKFLVRIKCEVYCYCHIAGEYERCTTKNVTEQQEKNAISISFKWIIWSALKNCIEYV